MPVTLGRWLLLLPFACCACGRATVEQSPIATVRHFLEVMERSADEESALREAYLLIDFSARTALARRAERASTLSGRSFEPWQMLAKGRFQLRFVPAQRSGMHERIKGETAIVTVIGEKAGERADVPLVREQGRWRIQLAIPALHKGDAPTTG